MESRDTAAAILAMELVQATNHEVRALLGTAQAQLAILHHELRDDHAAVSRIETLGRILGEINEALRGLRNSLDAPSLSLEPVVLRQLWDDSIRQMEGRLVAQRVRTIYRAPTVIIQADRRVFPQVFIHLMLVSIAGFAASPVRHGREISLSTETTPGDGRVLVSYRDNCGTLGKRILESRYGDGPVDRTDPVDRGLFLAMRLIEKHGGEANVIGSAEGLRLDIDLPVIARRETAARHAKQRVLIVDDDHVSADATRDLLAQYDVEPVVAYSPVEAMDALEAYAEGRTFDIVLTDVNLSGRPGDKSGIEIARAIRKIDPSIPVVGYTAYYPDDELADEERQAFDQFIDRGGLSRQALRDTIGNVVESARRHSETAPNVEGVDPAADD